MIRLNLYNQDLFCDSQNLDLPSDVQIDSGFSPALKRWIANTRSCLISSSMNTSGMNLVFTEWRSGYSIVRELLSMCWHIFLLVMWWHSTAIS
jgi:hypothetical protein